MLTDEKIVTKIKEYDNKFPDENTGVYAVIEGGLGNKKLMNFLLLLVMFVTVFLISFTSKNPIISGAIIGGIVGGLATLSNIYCIITAGKKGLLLYKFNKLGNKIIDKMDIPYSDIEIAKAKKTSIWNSIIIKNGMKKMKLVISEKTLGLKNQTENAKKLMEKLNELKKEERKK